MDFLPKPEKEYDMAMNAIKRDYQSADNNRQRMLLNDTANKLKASAPGGDGFHYSQEEAYKNLLEQTLNPGNFEYNLDSDPRWQSYRKSYGREGDRAQENALAKAAAMTGGRPSSYAVTAAAQAGNYYAGKLNDIIPKLYGQARAEHDADFTQKLQQLQAMQKDKDDEYNIYIDGLNEAYRQKQAAAAEAQQKYNNAMAFYRQFGYATPEVAEILGIPAGMPASSGGGGGGGYYGGYSGGSGSGSGKKEANPDGPGIDSRGMSVIIGQIANAPNKQAVANFISKDTSGAFDRMNQAQRQAVENALKRKGW